MDQGAFEHVKNNMKHSLMNAPHLRYLQTLASSWFLGALAPMSWLSWPQLFKQSLVILSNLVLLKRTAHHPRTKHIDIITLSRITYLYLILFPRRHSLQTESWLPLPPHQFASSFSKSMIAWRTWQGLPWPRRPSTTLVPNVVEQHMYVQLITQSIPTQSARGSRYSIQEKCTCGYN